MNSITKKLAVLVLMCSAVSQAVDFNGSEIENYLSNRVTKEQIAQNLTEEPAKFELNFTVLLQSVPSDLTKEEKSKLIKLEDEINRHLIEYNSNREPQFAIKLGGAVIGAVVAYTAVYRGMGAHTVRGDLTTFAAKGLVAVIGLGVGVGVGGLVYVGIDQLLEKPHILPSTTRLFKYIE